MITAILSNCVPGFLEINEVFQQNREAEKGKIAEIEESALYKQGGAK